MIVDNYLFSKVNNMINGEVSRRTIFMGFFLIALLALFVLLLFVTIAQYQHLIAPLLFYVRIILQSVGLMTLLTPIMKLLSKKMGNMDLSKSTKCREKATPLLGGLSLYLGFVTVACVNELLTPQLWSMVFGGGIVLLIGIMDDIYTLSSTKRLFGQIIAALIVISSGLVVSFTNQMFFGNVVAGIITIVWILGIVNAMNFIDGVDGLATGIALIASTFFLIIALRTNQTHLALTTAIMIGCCTGFLFHNFKPAKIYLGDSGSTFLGFMLACFALYGGWSDKGFMAAFGIPTLILGVIIFDIIYITISRIIRGKVKNIRQWLDFRGKDHFHHRLINFGFKEEHAVCFIFAVSIMLGLGALVLEATRMSYPIIILLAQAILVFTTMSTLMIKGRQNALKARNKIRFYQRSKI